MCVLCVCVCVCVCVCEMQSTYSEHKFWVWDTILGHTSRPFLSFKQKIKFLNYIGLISSYMGGQFLCYLKYLHKWDWLKSNLYDITQIYIAKF